MAKIGYLFLAKTLTTRKEDLEWMKGFGCDTIIEEVGTDEKYRPLWRRLPGTEPERRHAQPRPPSRPAW